MLTKMVNGVEVVLTAEEEAVKISEWDAERITITEDRRIQAIKDESDYRIGKLFISNCPRPVDKIKLYEKELNGLMQNAELDNIVISGRVLTAEQQSLKATFDGIKDAIKDIRLMSDRAESNPDALEAYVAALDAKGY